MKNLKCFTLAEVLITLAIIGVVAAMTIPTLISKMSQRAAEARQKTIEARLLDGINRYSALEDGLSQHYDTTYDFLVGLSKHYKMAQICKADEITNCIPYSTITYTSDGEDATVDVSTLTTTASMLPSESAEDYLPPASFITAQGTPVIMAFKKDCAWDMGKAMRSIQDSGCIAYMYDESGTRNPNKLGKDIIAHGLTIVPPSSAPAEIATVGGVKIMEQAFFPSQGLTSAECQAEADLNYGITKANCGGVSDDRWAAAMKYCHDKGYRLPNEQESLAIVNGLFKDTNGNHPSGSSWDSNTYKIDLNLVSTLGLKRYDGSSLTQDNVDVYLWSSVELSSSYAYRRNFHTNRASWDLSNRNNTNKQVLCLGD